MQFEIVKNKPIPPKYGCTGGGNVATAELRSMEVGDAINLGPCDDKQRNVWSSRANMLKQRKGLTFTTRKIDGNLWIWRTS